MKRAAPVGKAPKLWRYRRKNQSLRVWGKEYGIEYQTLVARLNKGMSLRQALSQKTFKRGPKQQRRFVFRGRKRTVIELRVLENLTYEEIQRVTGMPMGTVSSRLHRERRVLHTKFLSLP